ncbi:glutathione S-transferase family protein [Martelella sp. AD-3]|uniref:glutathione S-transferase family protein n=1 Tax=Martelella sp. AD-3 TaxID=686597 RepID=UPI000464A09B|nr:glutathione S-transferase family protein [Martelella sp. AD-3]AMM84675.1 beta-aryl ether-cleaving protein [Martelella sp. AD-3]MAM12984.1 beta-aryl ether-cleaving protein [Rhizobiaceae bacterium]
MSRVLYSLCGADGSAPFSPHCWKVVLALKHKGLDFEEKPVGFTEIAKLENGFSRTVPILRDGDQLIADSFAIAIYLEQTYPDRPSLFSGEGGLAMARFVEAWSQATLHPAVTRIAVKHIHDMLGPVDQAYFRESREARLGATLEEVVTGREAEIAAFPEKCAPLRNMLKFQPFIGGNEPLFCDYIVFGAFQWAALTGNTGLLDPNDPVANWFERCLEFTQKG